MSMEVPQTGPIKMNFILKNIVKGVTKFCKSWGYEQLHLSFGGDGELPHMASPLYQTCDRMLVTRSDEPLPSLGKPIPEPGASTRLRRMMKPSPTTVTTYNDEDVFTFSFNQTFLAIR